MIKNTEPARDNQQVDSLVSVLELKIKGPGHWFMLPISQCHNY